MSKTETEFPAFTPHAYIDTIAVWFRRRPREADLLAPTRNRLYDGPILGADRKPIRGKDGHRVAGHWLMVQQPRRDEIRVLDRLWETHDGRLSRVEIALDLVPRDPSDVGRLHSRICDTLSQPYSRGRDLEIGEEATTFYSNRRRAQVARWKTYPGESKVSSEACVRLEFQACGTQLVNQHLSIKRPGQLLDLDVDGALRPKLRLEEPTDGLRRRLGWRPDATALCGEFVYRHRDPLFAVCRAHGRFRVQVAAIRAVLRGAPWFRPERFLRRLQVDAFLPRRLEWIN